MGGTNGGRQIQRDVQAEDQVTHVSTSEPASKLIVSKQCRNVLSSGLDAEFVKDV
jgi:precorrin-6x reductase